MGQPTIDRVTNSEAAERAYRSGDAVFKKGKKVAVRPREGGDLQVVDASEVAARLDSGWALATEDEKGAYVQRKKYGEGIGNELAALPLAGARALSLGTSDALIRTVGGDEAAGAVRGIKEENPVASAVGEYGTDIATTVLTGGGAGLLKGLGKTALKQTAKGVGKKALRAGAETGASKALARKAIGTGGAGLRAPVAKTGAELTLKGSGAGAIKTAAAYTPLGAAARTGATAEYLAARVTKSKAAQLAVSGGIEASLVGAGQGLSRAALDTDHEFTADRALANMASGGAEGLVIGGLTGGVLGGALTGATRLAGRAASTGKGVASKLAAKRSAKVGARSADNAAPVSAAESLRKRVAGDAVDNRTAVARLKDQSRAPKRVTEVEDQTIHGLTEDLNGAAIAKNKLDETINVGGKRRQFEAAMDDHPPAASVTQMDEHMGTLRANMREFTDFLGARKASGEITEAGGVAATNKMKRYARGFEAQIEEAATITNPKRAAMAYHEAADRLKNRLGKAEKLANRTDRETGEKIRIMRESLRDDLENDHMWGGAGRLQKEWNVEWGPRIKHGDDMERELLRRDVHSRANSVDMFSGADPKKVASFVRSADNAVHSAQGGTLRTMQDSLQADLRFFTRSEELFTTTAGERAQIATLKKHTESALKRVDELLKTKGDAAAWAEHGIHKVAGVAEEVPVVGKPIVKGVAMMAKGASAAAEALTHVQAGADTTTIRIGDAVQAFLHKAASKAAPAAAASTARAFTGRDRDEQVAKVYSAVEGYESDPVSATRRTAAAAGVTGVAPAMAAAMATRGAEVAQLLGSKLPRKEITAASLYGGTLDGPPDMSETEKDEILAYAQAATDPMSVVDDFENGVLSFEAVDALKTAWPAIYTQLRDETIEGLAELTEPPPYGERLQLGLLLDIPTDETLEPEFIARIQGGATGKTEQQAADEQQAALPPSRRSAPDLAGDSETKSQRLSR